eukprot:1202689-Amphidinium_carterae.1
MVGISESDVFRAGNQMVVNGAMAVDKIKTIGGVERRCQRFIAILTPVNEYFTSVLNDMVLPYIGQMCSVVLDGSDVLF